MTGPCPYDCDNKTELGYCMSTGCVNPKYAQIVFWSHNNNTFQSPCANCPNNPANNPMASGVCHCILGTPTIY